MPKTVRDVPPPLELLCLNALWSLKQGKVKDVRQIVSATRPLAYTTIMTVLDRLVRKGKLARRKMGRAFVYIPQSSRDAMRHTAIRELVDGFFDGSEEELLRFLRPEAKAAAAAAGGEAAPAHPADDSEGGPIDTVLL
jgi:predicted transcriptional regulator